MLHLVFQPLTDQVILARLAPGDEVVFFEQAVFALLKHGQLAGPLTALLGHNAFFVLADDLAARGISGQELLDGITVVDYAGLVDLTVKNPVIQSWA